MDIIHLGILFYISPVHMLFHHCVSFTYVFVLICLWMLYLWLLRYFSVLHKICSLVELHIGNRVMHISCELFFIPLLSFSLTCIQKNHIKTLLFELVVTYIKTHIFVPNLSISHIFISILKFFYCFLILGQLFTWNIQPCTTLIQHQPYTIFEKI